MYRVSSKRLTESALEVKWERGSPATYLVSVNSVSLLVPCDNDTTPCLTFFTGLTLSGSTVNVRVQKEDEERVVETTLMLDGECVLFHLLGLLGVLCIGVSTFLCVSIALGMTLLFTVK